MATWGLHLRIAERILKNGYQLDVASFLVGNIGPDCGIPNQDFTVFDPPPQISHWCDGSKLNIEAERFAQEYLVEFSGDLKQMSFYLGYYVHLLTDKEFSYLIQGKIENDPSYAPLHENNDFIWTIKKDWYDQDHLYFANNPSSLFFQVFSQIRDFPDYLDYYPQGAVYQQVEYIVKFYDHPTRDLNREYRYLTKAEMDDFLEDNIADFETKLAAKLERLQMKK